MSRIAFLTLLLLASVTLSAEGPYAPSDHRLVSFGRVDKRDATAWRFDWSGVSVGFRFQGQDFAVLLQDGGADFNVFVDGVLNSIWRTRKGEERYEVSGLREGEHRVKIQRRSEAGFGVTTFKGIDLPRGGKLLEPGDGWHKRRKLEFVGASWVCGYGNEGPGLTCTDLRPVQNAALAFPELTAELLDAESTTVAYSGLGLVRNYGDKSQRSTEPFPPSYGRSVYGDPKSEWDFKAWVPDAVVINLGGNDFSTEPHPVIEEFINAEVALLGRMRAAYPKALLLCFVTGGWPAYKPHIEAAIERRLKSGDNNVHLLVYDEFKKEDLGCNWHPKVWGHRRLAAQLAPWLKEKLGW